MTRPPRRTPVPPPSGGEAGGFGPSLALVAVAAGLLLGAGAWWFTASASERSAAGLAGAPAPVVAAAPPAAGVAATAPSQAVAPPATALAAASPPLPALASVPPGSGRNRDPQGDATPDLSDVVAPGEAPAMGDVIARLNQAGVHTGLGAFNPPGTRPPLVGIAVPEDYPLPPGYVRHHQVTDDGQRIEAILMYAPDRSFVDVAGQQVAVPRDRVVPPELAPPGLALRRITVPPPAPQPRPGS